MMYDEELESLLRAADESAGPPRIPPPDLSGRVRHLARRRRTRSMRWKIGGALIGCYAAGLLTMWCGVSWKSAQPRDAAPFSASLRPSFEPNKVERRKTVSEQGTGVRKLVAQASRYQLLRQLGDENWWRNDIPAAVAYYGQALDSATGEELEISYSQDNMLLISLKKDRNSQPTRKEGNSI